MAIDDNTAYRNNRVRKYRRKLYLADRVDGHEVEFKEPFPIIGTINKTDIIDNYILEKWMKFYRKKGVEYIVTQGAKYKTLWIEGEHVQYERNLRIRNKSLFA